MATEQIETYIDTTQDDDKVNKQPATDGEELIIDTVDDRPPQDRNRRPRDPGTGSAQPTDEEMGRYTEGVQKRLSQMRREYHDERRAKEQWQREREVAIDFAQRLHQENQKLRNLLQQGHQTLLQSSKASADNEVKALQESLKAALDQGDTQRAAQLQAEIARAAARGEAVAHVQPIRFDDQQQQPQQQQPQQDQQWQQPQQQQPQRPQLSREMQRWMDDNPWFGVGDGIESRMTAVAYSVHNEMFNQGERMETPEYFKKINDAVRETFPSYFERNRQQSADQRPQVASVDRKAPQTTNPKRVALTLSEKAVAKKMGISEVAYAREKLRLEQEANG